MQQQRMRTTVTRTPAAADEAPLQQTSPSSLLEEARMWRDVAREALAGCETGEDAGIELARRKNDSGQ